MGPVPPPLHVSASKAIGAFKSETGSAGTFSGITSICTEVQGELVPPHPTDRTLIVAGPLKAWSHCMVPLLVICGWGFGDGTNWIDWPGPTGAAVAIKAVFATAASIIIWLVTLL